MKSKLQLLLSGILGGLLAILIFQSLQPQPQPQWQYTPPPLTPTSYIPDAGVENADFVTAASKTIDGVVHVKNIGNYRGSQSTWFGSLYGSDGPSKIGTGSGVVVSPDGYIITNYHVIEDASDIEVTTNDNKKYNATLIGSDAYTDIAVLKIESDTPLQYISFGDSDIIQVGEWVLAVGNPFNLNATVTAGIVSAKARDLNSKDDKNQFFLQTDAAVNQGNSGGALVNLKGELVGINTAISSLNGGYVGYSFAVPSNIARKVFEDLLEYGSVQKGLMGVQGAALNADVASELGLVETEGFYVSSIQKDMGAAKAGLQAKDIITQVDGFKINKYSDLTSHLSSKRPGDKVQVKYLRAGVEKETTIVLKKTSRALFIGLELENPEASELEKFDIDYGVRITTNRNRGLLRYGIDEGYYILEINKNKMDDVDKITNYSMQDVDNILFMSPEGEKVLIPFRY
ncbi:MAG: S1C family serine protease [Flavobacteriaceae bacterium]